MKRRGRQTSTIRPHSTALDDLRERHRSSETARVLGSEFAVAEAAMVARPASYTAACEAAAFEAAAADKAKMTAIESSNARKVPPVADEMSDEEDNEDTWMTYQLAVSAGKSKKRQYTKAEM